MEYLVLGLLLLAAWLGWLARTARRDRRILLGRLETAVPHLARSGLDMEALDPFVRPLEWRVVRQGGNNQAGIIGGLGACPCQKEYTVATRQSRHGQMPNPGQIRNCVNNPPPPADDCVQVMTHVWHGWMVVQRQGGGPFILNCHTSAQYHCKKPDDPAVDGEPREGPPIPEPEVEA